MFDRQSAPAPQYPRFYCPDLTLSDHRGRLGTDESHHACHVLRLAAGSRIELFDGRGQLANAVISAYTSGAVDYHIEQMNCYPPLSPEVTVAAAVAKGSRGEEMVNHLAQLGVSRLIPLMTERSVVEPRENKLRRFERFAVTAAKQCGSLYLMQIDKPASFTQVLDQYGGLRILLNRQSVDEQADSPVIEQLQIAEHVLLLIGPEGGWSPSEQAEAGRVGAVSWQISVNTLRIETAAVAAAAICRFLMLEC